MHAGVQSFTEHGSCRAERGPCPLAQVYVWGRRHQYVNLSFLGIFNFTAPYLPWVLLGFSVILGSSPVVDLLGMVAGRALGDLTCSVREPPDRLTVFSFNSVDCAG